PGIARRRKRWECPKYRSLQLQSNDIEGRTALRKPAASHGNGRAHPPSTQRSARFLTRCGRLLGLGPFEPFRHPFLSEQIIVGLPLYDAVGLPLTDKDDGRPWQTIVIAGHGVVVSARP